MIRRAQLTFLLNRACIYIKPPRHFFQTSPSNHKLLKVQYYNCKTFCRLDSITMGVEVIAKPFETTLSAAVLKKAYCEWGEDEERRQQVIAIIRQWVAQQPHLQRIRLGNLLNSLLYM